MPREKLPLKEPNDPGYKKYTNHVFISFQVPALSDPEKEAFEKYVQDWWHRRGAASDGDTADASTFKHPWVQVFP